MINWKALNEEMEKASREREKEKPTSEPSLNVTRYVPPEGRIKGRLMGRRFETSAYVVDVYCLQCGAVKWKGLRRDMPQPANWENPVYFCDTCGSCGLGVRDVHEKMFDAEGNVREHVATETAAAIKVMNTVEALGFTATEGAS